MKHGSWLTAALISVALVATLGACAKPPKAEVDAAQAAIARAESDADVPVYAADSLARAKDTFSRMRKELDAKKYDAAKALAKETVQAADKAIADAKTNKDRAKNSAASTLGAVKTAIGEAETALAAAKQTRGVKLDFAAVGEELEAIKRSATSAESDFSNGMYKPALEKAESAQSKLRDLSSRIADAVREASRKK